jgi:MFS family permease
MVKIHSGLWSAIACIVISFFSSISLQTSGMFLPIFANSLGASKLQIGIIGGVQGAAYLITSIFFGRLSDIKGRLPFIRLGLGLAALCYALHILVHSPVTLVMVRAMLGFCIAMSDAALMAYNFESSGKTGRFVSLAALGWLTGGIITIFYQDYHGLFILASVTCLVAFAISWTLAKEQHRHTVRPAITRMIGRNARVYVPFLLRNIGANMVWFIMPLFIVGLGASLSWIAILQCLNTATQFIVMMFVDRMKASVLFLTGMLLSGVVFAGYALSRSYLQLVPFQVVLALSWSGIYVGALLTLFKNSEERATSVAILLSTGSLSQAIGPFMGGFVVQWWGYHALMWAGTTFCLGGTMIAVITALRHRNKHSLTLPVSG